MLNKKKQINFQAKKNTSIPSFFNLPFLPVNSYLQANSSVQNLNDLNLVSKDLNAKTATNNFRYNFSSKTYRTSFLFSKYKRAKFFESKITNFKKYLLFIDGLYKNSKKYPIAITKKIKGGFMARSFGINTFMPQSHFLNKKKGGTKQILLQVKAWRRKKKYCSKKNWKFNINLVSSAKNAKKLAFSSAKIFTPQKNI